MHDPRDLIAFRDQAFKNYTYLYFGCGDQGIAYARYLHPSIFPFHVAVLPLQTMQNIPPAWLQAATPQKND